MLFPTHLEPSKAMDVLFMALCGVAKYSISLSVQSLVGGCGSYSVMYPSLKVDSYHIHTNMLMGFIQALLFPRLS